MPKGPVLAVVCWLDAQMEGHWNSGAPAPDPDLTVYSAGWLLVDNKKNIVLVQSLTDGSFGNSLTIPRGMVQSIQRIGME